MDAKGLPKVGDRILRIESGERCYYLITAVNQATRTITAEPISIAGYSAIGVPITMKIERRSAERREE